jgi:hypothetical protein
LARTLIERASNDEALPIPVVLPLSTWAVHRRALDAWLAEELYERYDVPPAVARAWVAHERILPLLDGLDEVPPEHRAACVEAINAFCVSRGEDVASLARLAVCCRTGDYREADVRLRVQRAVLLRPLAPRQVDAYLARGGARRAALRAALQQDDALLGLAASPLWLGLMAAMSGDSPAEALPTGGSAGDLKRRLLAAYVDRMFDRRRHDPRFPRERTLHWLGWLASALPRRSQSVFYLERLQPEWLPARAHRGWYALLDRAGFGLLFGVLGGWIGWLLSQQVVRALANHPAGPQVTGGQFAVHYGLAVFLVSATGIALMGGRQAETPSVRRRVRSALSSFMLGALIGGTVFGVVYGVNFEHGLAFRRQFLRAFWMYGLLIGALYALLGGLAGGAALPPRRVILAESLRRSAWRTTVSVAIGAFIGLLGWAVYRSLRPSSEEAGQQALAALLVGPAGALLGSVVIGVLFGVVFGLSGGEVPDQSTMTPNQSIHRSARRATKVGLTTGIVVGALGGVGYGLSQGAGNVQSGLLYGLGVGMVFAVAGALVSGGYACLSHLTMRVVLWRADALPLDATRFLDYAAERIFLRKAGGGYLFVNRLLQEHLASQETEG